MRDESSGLSQEALEQLIARASEIDDQRRQMVDLARAREIAAELGIGEDAWNAAVREHVGRPSPVVPAPRPRRWRAAILSAVGGLAAGGIMGSISAASSGDDIVIGSVLIALSVALTIQQTLGRARGEAQASIAGWWGAASLGILLGLGDFSREVLWFGGACWLGCAALSALMPELAKHLQRTPSAAPELTS